MLLKRAYILALSALYNIYIIFILRLNRRTPRDSGIALPEGSYTKCQCRNCGS